MRMLLLSAALAVTAASGCSKDKANAGETAKAEFAMMSLDAVEAAIAADTVTAVDCNGERTRKKLGIVPGAIVISDEEAFAPSELPTDKTRKLVFYCSDTA
jgi:hypothetical protein